MGLFFMLKFPESIPVDIAGKLKGIVSIKDEYVEIFDAESVPWHQVFDILDGSRIHLSSSSLIYAMDTEPFDWAHHHEQAVAAVLEPDLAYPPSNPEEDYNPQLPSPHWGFVPKDRPVHIVNKPEGHVARVGEEVIISGRLADFFKRSFCDAELGKVIQHGHALPGWVRLYPVKQCGIIGPESLLPSIHCAICDALLIPRLGIWLAKSNVEFRENIAIEELGFDHLGNQHPILLSCEVARQVAKRFRSGLRLEPVYRMNSAKASIVIEFINRIKRLVR